MAHTTPSAIYVSHIQPTLKIASVVAGLRAKQVGTSLGVQSQGAWASLKEPIDHFDGALDPCIAKFAEFTGLQRDDYGAAAWATILDIGQETGRHNHHQATWAWVWILTEGSPLVLQPDIYIDATPGAFIVFPATTQHWVEPNTTIGRASIACNVHV